MSQNLFQLLQQKNLSLEDLTKHSNRPGPTPNPPKSSQASTHPSSLSKTQTLNSQTPSLPPQSVQAPHVQAPINPPPVQSTPGQQNPKAVPSQSSTNAQVYTDLTTNPPEEVVDTTKKKPKEKNTRKKARRKYHKRSFYEIYRYLVAYDKFGEGNPEEIVNTLATLHIFTDWEKNNVGYAACLQYLRDLKVEGKSPLLKEFKPKRFQLPKGDFTDEEVRTLQRTHVKQQAEEQDYWKKGQTLLQQICQEDKLGTTAEKITEEELLNQVTNQGRKRKNRKKEGIGRLINAFNTDLGSREFLGNRIDNVTRQVTAAVERYNHCVNLMEAFFTKIGVTLETQVTSSQTTQVTPAPNTDIPKTQTEDKEESQESETSESETDE